MIVEVKMYTVKCDNCGKEYEDIYHTGFCAWSDSGTALYQACESGWVQDETQEFDRHYCDNCHSIDEDDNIILKEVK